LLIFVLGGRRGVWPDCRVGWARRFHGSAGFLGTSGDSGTGKSHLLIALGTEAAMAGFRVRYTLATKLVNELVEAADEKVLAKTIARYGRVDLLCIDELGYMELDRCGAELLFQVLTEREEKNSLAIASNDSFGGWTRTDSYRLAHARAQADRNP
jgi:DNA replication protein DnaC